ncbi:unnamed protein product [Spodoptera littoralis]|uniref:Uncharacterized protein n=1 Tax=Spodoptera littoralis TaxID=7109 RepID=A0A9P0N5D6_SPOLI|nr:unnamed protein product [Spodoptera littoralis]CAH1642153.1 unnamed protein product [Spodoptera littoralis]
MRQFVVVCDFKLFLYDISQDRNALPSVCVSQVLDMRDPDFSVTSVKESDVIHASKRDIPCIFRISTSQLEGGKRSHTLMLAESESEKTKWVVALSELHRILKRNNLPDKCVYSACVLLDSTAAATVRNALCACVLERSRVCIGGEAGLCLLDLERAELTPRRQHAPVTTVAYVPQEQLLVVIAGRGRHVRLVPIRALECAEVECIKLAESKGALSLAAGPLGHSAHGFAVLCKKQNAYVVNVYEITRTAARRVRVAELRACGAVLSLQLAGARLLLGYRGGIAAHCLPDPRRPHHDQPAVSLVHPENQVNVFLSHSGARPLGAAPLACGDTLLVFNSLALYVDRHGHRARDTELMYTAHPTHHAINDTHLLIFTATHIDVYDIETGDWVQTMNIPSARPLDETGWICCVGGGSGNGFPFSTDAAPFIIYLRPLLTHPRASDPPLSVDTSLWGNKRRFSVREQSHQAIEAHNRLSERRSRLISAPTNFAHLSHMGPGDGIRSQRLLDLPTTVETADDHPQMYSSRESSKRTSPLTISHGTGSYNGSWRSAGRRDAPCDPPASPPRMERSLGGGSQGSGSLLERSITPLSLGSMSSLHDVLKVGTELGDGLHSEDSSCGASPPHPMDP